MIIQICVGSSCHLKGAPEIVRLLREAVSSHGLEKEVTLAGSFCTGKCNRIGVTVQVDDHVYTGITPDCFDEFFKANVLAQLR